MKVRMSWLVRVVSVVLCVVPAGMFMTGTVLEPPVARAATLTVTTTADSGAGSLRQAILDAAAGNTITFSLPASSTITLSSSLSITKTLTIDGAGAPGLTISGNHTNRVFQIGAPVTLANMTIADGQTPANADGGAVYVANTSALKLTNVTVRDSMAARNGGGVYAGGLLTMIGTTMISNTAQQDGGGAYFAGPATVIGTTMISNTAATFGGGASFSGPATVSGTTFSSNTARFGGGAFFSGTAMVSDTTFSSNTATSGGGALFVGTATVIGTTMISNTAHGLAVGRSSLARQR